MYVFYQSKVHLFYLGVKPFKHSTVTKPCRHDDSGAMRGVDLKRKLASSEGIGPLSIARG